VLYPEEKIAEYQANILKGLEKGVQVELYKKLCETIDNSST
jgi:hypothetical protein